MSELSLRYHAATDVPPATTLESIVSCMRSFMRESSVERWIEKLEHRDAILVQWVTSRDQVIAFKAGYMLRPGLFYSWLGGVTPEFRKNGVASKLLKEQHDYAQSIGCSEIRTISTNAHKEMIICNLKHGFDILETKVRGEETRVVMSKKL